MTLLPGAQRPNWQSDVHVVNSIDLLNQARAQWLARGWADADVMVAIGAIVKANRLLVALIDNALRPLDLSHARYSALGMLYFGSSRALPLGEMSERLGVHPATITSIVDRLEQQGVVSRVRPDGDRRVVLATILPDGEAVTARATDILVNEIFPTLQWTKEELETIARLLSKLPNQ